MTQLLNRLITVTGESTISEHVDTRFHYDGWGIGGAIGLQGYWDVVKADGILYREASIPDSNALAAVLADGESNGITVFLSYYLNADRIARVELPFPSLLGKDVPLTIRIHGPTDDDYLEGIVTAVDRRETFHLALIGWTLRIPGTLTKRGNTFPVGDDLTFSFVGRGSSQPVAESTKEVWARLSERGADVGLVVGDLGRGEGAQEQITARLRYDPDLAIAKEFTDDLGRRWFATSTRTEEERRYLVVEGVRYLTGIDLPEFATDT